MNPSTVTKRGVQNMDSSFLRKDMMILEKWYIERVRLWNGAHISTNTLGTYLIVRGNTPETLEGNLRKLANDLIAAADQIHETREEHTWLE
jgi:hypothetical protein